MYFIRNLIYKVDVKLMTWIQRNVALGTNLLVDWLKLDISVFVPGARNSRGTEHTQADGVWPWKQAEDCAGCGASRGW